ncbi:carbohydrate kinase family protein [Actinomycetospora straminea]|uniref:Carbohydrate kinase n=1 Tax=Actinomycetospora straminea TaxID=663607 RepID=A0ABP9EAP5_9PSEU|nr:carbohydrate kinase [Actinomycetospora straminea]MDD7932116.1 carbohydrate kinase [Actinomycetospora straminea]
MTGRVVVGGEALVDLVPTGDEHPDDPALRALAPRLGGGPFNVAVGLGRLGVPTTMLTRLSTDAFGEALVRRLDANDVDTSLLQRGPEPTTLAVVTLDGAGAAQYAFHVAGSADRLVADPGELPADTAALAVGTLSLVLEPGASRYAALAVREAERGRLVSLDPNLRPGLADDPGAVIARLDAIAAVAGLVKLSDEDAERWGRTPSDLLDAGAGAVVLTRGAEGLTAHTRGGGVVAVPADAVGPLVDTIGAGDSVHAALLAWLAGRGALDRAAVADLDADAWSDALRSAARAAAWTVSRAGAEPPWRHELDGSLDGSWAPARDVGP